MAVPCQYGPQESLAGFQKLFLFCVPMNSQNARRQSQKGLLLLGFNLVKKQCVMGAKIESKQILLMYKLIFFVIFTSRCKKCCQKYSTKWISNIQAFKFEGSLSFFISWQLSSGTLSSYLKLGFYLGLNGSLILILKILTATS